MNPRYLTNSLLVLSLALLQTTASAQTADDVRRMIEQRARTSGMGHQFEIIEVVSVRGTRGWRGRFQQGDVYYVPLRGVISMSNAMKAAYQPDSSRNVTHGLGFPVTDELPCSTPDARDRYQLFEGGTIFWRQAASQYDVQPGMAPPSSIGNCAPRAGPRGTVVTGPDTVGLKTMPRYRVTILGFSVARQTEDDAFNYDGRGDEVYLVAQVIKFQPNGVMVSETLERSVLLGDTDGRPGDEERVMAGRLTDYGGIGTGDRVMPNFVSRRRLSRPNLPWVVFEGDLSVGAVMVIPSIWEWDNDDASLNFYRSWNFRGAQARFFYDQGREPQGTDSVATGTGRGWVTQLVSESVRSKEGIAPTSVWGQGPVISNRRGTTGICCNGDFPIGVWADRDPASGRRFIPKILFLTPNLARRVVTMNFPLPAVQSSEGSESSTTEQFGRLGAGVVPIRYSDGADGGTGDYTIYVKVEEMK